MFNGFYAPWRHHFDAFQQRGFHVLPVHYYSPVPDTRELNPEIWAAPSKMTGVKVDEGKAKALLRDFAARYKREYETFPADAPPGGVAYYRNNPAFRSVDAAMLYCFVRSLRPRRIVEIGSGFSTLVIRQALGANRADSPSYTCDFKSIEPHLPEYLNGAGGGGGEFICSRLQDVPLDLFDSLGENDILFIDSTHVLRTGGDVQREYLEILPRLSPGVVVHIHDIFLPSEYPEEWIKKMRFFWNEQYLLQAFLCFNDRFETLWPAHLMHLNHPDELAEAIPGYEPARTMPSDAPASWWMRRV